MRLPPVQEHVKVMTGSGARRKAGTSVPHALRRGTRQLQALALAKRSDTFFQFTTFQIAAR
jgi:hypothetical protein